MKHLKKVLLVVLAVIVVAVFLFVGLNKKEEKEKTIQIASILPLSGNLAKIGLPKKNAMELAIAQINAQNKLDKKIEFFYQDSKGLPKDGLSIFHSYLSTTDIKYYYIDLTPIVNVAAPVINKNQVLTFAGSAQPEVTNLSPWLFRLFAGGEQEIEIISNYLTANNIKSIYVLHSNEIYGSSAYDYLKKLFEKNDSRIIGKDDYPLDIKDARNILLKAKNSGAEKIVLLGYGVEFSVMLKQMKELGIPRTSIVMNLGATNALVIALGGDYTDDITFVGPKFSYLLESNQLSEEMQRFVQDYKTKFKETPDFRAAYAYDTMMILCSVWQKVDSNDLKKVAEEIRKLKNYPGVSGRVSFLANGDSLTDLVLAQYKQGKMVLIGN